ncbi:hypothetical protein [Haloferax sulfurifontis]|uniref:Uncharacterized protein n=1 Tax=Haloferax sulfurifontis ATCC BAA-897 TaxID=662480 RepID=M0IB19_9EURY|nr:hypothetical protein [Haloferax sulfurifontis]ELZ92644.1 hypothetical protein C441_10508 [Haloferax sulfurifontis ATCC BAA-897]
MATNVHMERSTESLAGFRPGALQETKERIELAGGHVRERSMLGFLFGKQFAWDLRRHAADDGLGGVARYVKDYALFEYHRRARNSNAPTLEVGSHSVDLAAGMEVLGLMTGLIMLSVGLLVYSETQAAMPAPEDPQLANASDGLNDTAVSVVNLSKVAFIIGAAAIMISYLIGSLGGGFHGGGGIQ